MASKQAMSNSTTMRNAISSADGKWRSRKKNRFRTPPDRHMSRMPILAAQKCASSCAAPPV
jgi:hypothetical protein